MKNIFHRYCDLKNGHQQKMLWHELNLSIVTKYFITKS